MSEHKELEGRVMNTGGYGYEQYMKELKGFNWRPVSELRVIDEDISRRAYKLDHVKRIGLDPETIPQDINGNYRIPEPVFVAEDKGAVYFDTRLSGPFLERNGSFLTQLGLINTYSYGEGGGCLIIMDPDRPLSFAPHGGGSFVFTPPEFKEYEREGKLLYGNFIDVFDLGEYTYAIDSSYFPEGNLSIKRIKKDLNHECIYKNSINERITFLRHGEEFKRFREKSGTADTHYTSRELRISYIGRFDEQEGIVAVASGMQYLRKEDKTGRDIVYLTIMFRLFKNGDINILDEFKAESNSVAATGEYVYFGNERMVTRYNRSTGEKTFLTYKTEDEVAEMVET